MQNVEEERGLPECQQCRDTPGDFCRESAEEGQKEEVDRHGEGDVGETGWVFDDVEEGAEGKEVLVLIWGSELLGHAETVFGEIADVQEAR